MFPSHQRRTGDRWEPGRRGNWCSRFSARMLPYASALRANSSTCAGRNRGPRARCNASDTHHVPGSALRVATCSVHAAMVA